MEKRVMSEENSMLNQGAYISDAEKAQAKRDAENLNVARLLNHISQNPPREVGSFSNQDPHRDVASPLDPSKPLISVNRVHTMQGMMAESFLGADHKLYVMFRGSETLGPDNIKDVFKKGTQANEDWVESNALNHGLVKRAPAGSVSEWTPTQMNEACDYLKSMLEKYPNAEVIIGGHSKGGAEATFAAAMNKNILEDRKFRVISANGDSLHLNGAFRDIQAKNKLLATNDPFFMDHFEQIRVVSASGYKEVASSANQLLSSNIYLGQIKSISMPIDSEGIKTAHFKVPGAVLDLTGAMGNVFHLIANHGADHFEIAMQHEISTRHEVSTRQVIKEDGLSNIEKRLLSGIVSMAHKSSPVPIPREYIVKGEQAMGEVATKTMDASKKAVESLVGTHGIKEIRDTASKVLSSAKTFEASIVESSSHHLASLESSAQSLIPSLGNIAQKLRESRKEKMEATIDSAHEVKPSRLGM